MISSLLSALQWICRLCHPALLDALKERQPSKPCVATGWWGVVRDLLCTNAMAVPGMALPIWIGWWRAVPAFVGRPTGALRDWTGERRSHHGQFGTVALDLDGVPLDLATARQEQYPAPAKNPVVQPGSLAADLVRRDLTINAMAVDLISGELIDPTAARKIWPQACLQFLHPASVSDDPTRVIRAARYGARLGMALDPEALEQVRATVTAWPWDWHAGDAPRGGTAGFGQCAGCEMELDRLLDHEPWPIALDLLESWQAMDLVDPCLQRDPERTRRLHWGQRLRLPLMTALLAAAADPGAVARRLQIPGQQQEWLERLPSLKAWPRLGSAPQSASPDAWTSALDSGGWTPQTVALVVASPPCWVECRCCGGGAAGATFEDHLRVPAS